jgi:hypothetical protein
MNHTKLLCFSDEAWVNYCIGSGGFLNDNITVLSLKLLIRIYVNFDTEAEKADCLALVDFLRGLVEFDPNKRWSLLQVLANDNRRYLLVCELGSYIIVPLEFVGNP